MHKLFSLLAFSILLFACGDQQKPAVGQETANKDSIDIAAASVKADEYYAEDSTKKEPASAVEVKSLSSSLAAFILPGYSVLDTATGDLNLDAYPDALLILKKDGEEKTSNYPDSAALRPLIVLLGQADKSYKQAVRNDKVVLCVDCGGMMGDPYQLAVIKKGYFSIEHYGGSAWRWSRTITFKYNAGDSTWYLHKDGGDSYHSSDPDKVTTKVRTTKDFGQVRFDRFDVYEEQ